MAARREIGAQIENMRQMVDDRRHLDPAHLLALAQSLYATVPEAWLIAVPAVSFGLEQPLSAVAQAGLEQALGHVEHLCHP